MADAVASELQISSGSVSIRGYCASSRVLTVAAWFGPEQEPLAAALMAVVRAEADTLLPADVSDFSIAPEVGHLTPLCRSPPPWSPLALRTHAVAAFTHKDIAQSSRASCDRVMQVV